MSDFFSWPIGWLYPYPPGVRWEIEPEQIYQNATLKFCKLFEAYPASLWTLEYGLVPWAGTLEGPIRFSSTQLNGGDWFLIEVANSITASWKPQKYRWQCFAQANSSNPNPTDRFYVSQGIIDVLPDLTSAAFRDTRGKWQKILDEVDAMILSIAGDTQEEIAIGRGTIAGQTLRGWDRQKLMDFRDYALHMAGNEQRIQDRRGGAPNPRYKYAVMSGGGNGRAFNGFPDLVPFS